MSLDVFLKLVVAVLATVVSGAWAYMVWCVKQIKDVYKLKSDLATQQAEWLSKRVESTEPLIRIWEQGMLKMKNELDATKRKLGQTTSERNEIENRLTALMESVERARAKNDPISLLIAGDIDVEGNHTR